MVRLLNHKKSLLGMMISISCAPGNTLDETTLKPTDRLGNAENSLSSALSLPNSSQELPHIKPGEEMIGALKNYIALLTKQAEANKAVLTPQTCPNCSVPQTYENVFERFEGGIKSFVERATKCREENQENMKISQCFVSPIQAFHQMITRLTEEINQINGSNSSSPTPESEEFTYRQASDNMAELKILSSILQFPLGNNEIFPTYSEFESTMNELNAFVKKMRTPNPENQHVPKTFALSMIHPSKRSDGQPVRPEEMNPQIKLYSDNPFIGRLGPVWKNRSFQDFSKRTKPIFALTMNPGLEITGQFPLIEFDLPKLPSLMKSLNFTSDFQETILDGLKKYENNYFKTIETANKTGNENISKTMPYNVYYFSYIDMVDNSYRTAEGVEVFGQSQSVSNLAQGFLRDIEEASKKNQGAGW
jgi:hypothetical protein